MKGLCFHLGTLCIPCVIASPAQTSAIAWFLQKNLYGALISFFPEWSNTLLCIFFCPRKLLRPQNHRDLKEYISLTQLPCPSFVKIRLLASWNLNRFVCKDICFCIWSLACPSLSLNICIHGLLWPLSRIAFPQLLPLT